LKKDGGGGGGGAIGNGAHENGKDRGGRYIFDMFIGLNEAVAVLFGIKYGLLQNWSDAIYGK